jgi:hypothetical protein
MATRFSHDAHKRAASNKSSGTANRRCHISFLFGGKATWAAVYPSGGTSWYQARMLNCCRRFPTARRRRAGLAITVSPIDSDSYSRIRQKGKSRLVWSIASGNNPVSSNSMHEMLKITGLQRSLPSGTFRPYRPRLMCGPWLLHKYRVGRFTFGNTIAFL